MTDPTETRPDDAEGSVAMNAADHHLSRLARAALSVRRARARGRSERRALRRLSRTYDRASSAGVLLGDPRVASRMRQHLEGVFAADTLPDYTPTTHWTTLSSPNGATR